MDPRLALAAFLIALLLVIAAALVAATMRRRRDRVRPFGGDGGRPRRGGGQWRV